MDFHASSASVGVGGKGLVAVCVTEPVIGIPGEVNVGVFFTNGTKAVGTGVSEALLGSVGRLPH